MNKTDRICSLILVAILLALVLVPIYVVAHDSAPDSLNNGLAGITKIEQPEIKSLPATYTPGVDFSQAISYDEKVQAGSEYVIDMRPQVSSQAMER